MAAIEDMTRDELMDIIRGLKSRVRELEGAEINRRLTITEHPATIEAFMENVPDAVALMSPPDGAVRMISRHALELFELKKEHVLGSTLIDALKDWELLDPDGSRVGKCPTMYALSEGVSTRNREIIFRKDGKAMTALVNSSPVVDGSGKIIGCMTVWREITARKRAEEELWHEKEFFKKILEILPVGVWIIDANGKITDGNNAAREIWGGARYVGLESYGEYKAWCANTGVPVTTENWAAYRAFKNRETTLNEELEIEGFDGRRRIILNSAMPIEEDGEVIGAIAMNHDITERKRYEKALKESEKMLAEAQRIAHVGNWVWETGSDRFCGSDETYDIFELPPGTPVNYNEFMKMLHEDDREMVKSAMEEGLMGAVYKLEFRIVTAKGKIKYVQGIGELDAADGRGPVMKGILQDITERKEHENEQKRLMAELQDAMARIRTLSGLIPICANCKRIRDDKGYWQRIERFIEERSQAEFTHSLCPDCEKKLYGEMEDNKKE